MIDGQEELKKFIFTSKYARNQMGYKETWEQAVNRVMRMHEGFLRNIAPDWSGVKPYFDRAKQAYLDQKVIGAQRALQFGGEQLLKHHMRNYNCAGSIVNRPEFFKELMFVLLCGAGGGYSVQKHHVNSLPEIRTQDSKSSVTYLIPDSIEGWALAVDQLVNYYFTPGLKKPDFDYSSIRPEGAPVAGNFLAPGPYPLKGCLEAMDSVFSKAKGRKLTPFEAHRICCFIADSVISGGIRRSACICLFSVDDAEMMNCKTGDWFTKYPELGRANNSVVLTNASKDQFDVVFEASKQSGDPGFAFSKEEDFVYNPCFEISFTPWIDYMNGTPEFDKYSTDPDAASVRKYGWGVCNLTEINGKFIDTEDELIEAAEAAATLGTFQACYNKFKFLGEITEDIVKRDSLIGVSITGFYEKPDVLFNEEYLTRAAHVVVDTNKKLAGMLGLPAAARTTCVKPSGNASLMLGTCSGIHPYHSRKYIKHIQLNKLDPYYDIILNTNPKTTEPCLSASKNDVVVGFPVEAPDGAVTKSELTAVDFLENVISVQKAWVKEGINHDHVMTKTHPTLCNNVSNTCTVQPYEWLQVREYLWKHKEDLTGVSLLGGTGDLSFRQAPFTEVVEIEEILENYGQASLFASGLIVDGIHAFGDIWTATETALGIGQTLKISIHDLFDDMKSKFMESQDILNTRPSEHYQRLLEECDLKKDWVRRFRNFAMNFFQGDYHKTSDCLKRVSIAHKWSVITRAKPINWDSHKIAEKAIDSNTIAAQGCSGGQCEI